MPCMSWYFVKLKELKMCFSSDIVIITLPTLCCALQVFGDKADITILTLEKKKPWDGQEIPQTHQG